MLGSMEDVNAKAGEYARQRRECGFRPVQIWVPDARVPGFDAEARHQAMLVAGAASAAEDQMFIDSVSIVWNE